MNKRVKVDHYCDRNSSCCCFIIVFSLAGQVLNECVSNVVSLTIYSPKVFVFVLFSFIHINWIFRFIITQMLCNSQHLIIVSVFFPFPHVRVSLKFSTLPVCPYVCSTIILHFGSSLFKCRFSLVRAHLYREGRSSYFFKG